MMVCKSCLGSNRHEVTASRVAVTRASRAMLHSSMVIQDQIDDYVKTFNHMSLLCKDCQADGLHSYHVMVGKHISIDTAFAVVEVQVIQPEIRLSYVRDCKCTDTSMKAFLKIPVGVFERVVKKSETLYLANVCLKHDEGQLWILALHSQSAVVGDDISRTRLTDDLLIGEICAGGFSGWQHAQHVCKNLGLRVQSSFAVQG